MGESNLMQKAITSACEMCGHQVAILQKAHILAEGKRAGGNLLLLCLTCHIMFDTRLKPKISKALNDFGINLPKSWETSIYEQAAAASMKAKLKRNS
jgi:predicted restriction endonuclease